jgi:hypothetical protein
MREGNISIRCGGGIGKGAKKRKENYWMKSKQ